MIFVFWMLSQLFHSLSSFTFIKRLFSSSLLSAIRVVSSSYLRLFIFLPAILIPAWASSSLAFCMMYSAYKLNVQPWCTPFSALTYFPYYDKKIFLLQHFTCEICPECYHIYQLFAFVELFCFENIFLTDFDPETPRRLKSSPWVGEMNSSSASYLTEWYRRNNGWGLSISSIIY